MQRFKSMAWLLPYLAVAISDGLAKPLERWQGDAAAAIVACVLGWSAGVAWFSIYPRPLAERLNGLAALWALAVMLIGLVAIVHLFGGSIGTVEKNGGGSFGAYAAISVLAGLVLSEINSQSVARPNWRPWSPRPRSVPVERTLQHSDLSGDS